MGVSITECVREHDYFLEITNKQTNKQTNKKPQIFGQQNARGEFREEVENLISQILQGFVNTMRSLDFILKVMKSDG